MVLLLGLSDLLWQGSVGPNYILLSHSQIREKQRSIRGDGLLRKGGHPPPAFGSILSFIIIVGLEGSGHHLMGEVASESPHMQYLKEWQLYPTQLAKVQRLLFNATDPSMALWNAHCAESSTESYDGITTNLTHVQLSLVEQLRSMENLAQSATRMMPGRSPREIHIPINTVRTPENRYYGMASYPTLGGPCRPLNFPSLDLLYQACDMASVDCGHIYLHRDPVAILQSTTVHRKYNKNLVQAMHMYKTHLNVITAEIQAFPERTMGCYEILPSNKEDIPETAKTTEQVNGESRSWAQELGRFWGWTDDTDFTKLLQRVYDKKTSNYTLVVPPELLPYEVALREASIRTVRVCERSRHLLP